MNHQDLFDKCAYEQNEALLDLQTELRHALREAAHEALCSCCGETLPPVDPEHPPETADPRERRITRTIEAAEHFLSLNITEPGGENWELIDRFIRREKMVDGFPGSSVGCEWTTADAKTWVIDTPYTKNGMYSWCGAFAGTCLGAAGLLKSHRYNTMPSCSRMSGDWGGTDVEIDREDIQIGDIVTVGKASDGASHKGTHIVLVVGVGPRVIETIEGNATWQGREGVIRRTRPFEGTGSTYIIKKAYRPTDDMYGAMPEKVKWKW